MKQRYLGSPLACLRLRFACFGGILLAPVHSANTATNQEKRRFGIGRAIVVRPFHGM